MGRRPTGRLTKVIRVPEHLVEQVNLLIEQDKQKNITQPKRLSWLGYYGGKYRLSPEIVELMPSHRCYVEPYCGGAAVFFAKPKQQSNNHKEVLNDIDRGLTTLYKVCRDHPQEFYRRLSLTLYSRSELERAIEIRNNSSGYSEIELAVAIFVAIEQSFNNSIGRGWSISKNEGNHALSWCRKIENLHPTLERLKGVYVECLPAITCIKKWDSKATFFYIDPPYPNTDQGHYSGFTQSDFEELIEVLRGIKGKFILSNYDNSAIPSDWVRREKRIYCSSALTNSERTEVLWMNYQSSSGPLFD
jgi:DNA adenine methylase